MTDAHTDFDAYLTSRNIDARQFRQADPHLYHEWATLFGQVHPESFVAQKKFLLNIIRKKYLGSRNQSQTAQ